ncbi:MAG: class I SAM-dependent methyltransferase [Anaerolineales bacterium]|nr:class I SAM-dependent methyltransferase [Anaerolineales bacterium]
MYDEFSADYDRFVDWQSRLDYELPFIEAQLQRLALPDGKKARVLDAATGTGMHAIALAQRGYPAAGADLSAGMIARARQNAAAAGAAVRFEAAGFGALAQTFGRAAFDAVLCLGSSLPHLLSKADLIAALADFAACLRPGGLFLAQNINFDRVLERKARWGEPRSHRQGQEERLFLRLYDFDPDGLLTFHVLTLRRDGQDPWALTTTSTRLRPLPQADLQTALGEAGFDQVRWYGSLEDIPFDPASSGNLVCAAILPA